MSDKKQKPKPVAKSESMRKCNRRRNGVPQCSRDSLQRAKERLMHRPLHERARVGRMLRKLQLVGRFPDLSKG